MGNMKMNRREFSKLIGMSALAMQAFPGVVMAGNKGASHGSATEGPARRV